MGCDYAPHRKDAMKGWGILAGQCHGKGEQRVLRCAKDDNEKNWKRAEVSCPLIRRVRLGYWKKWGMKELRLSVMRVVDSRMPMPAQS